MKLQLMPSEETHLLWHPGDEFNVYSGVVTFTGREQHPAETNPPTVNTKHYFSWEYIDQRQLDATIEPFKSQIFMNGTMPNGPSLIIYYHRPSTDQQHTWGLIHMATRSSVHLWPFWYSPLMQDSVKMKRPAMKLLAGAPPNLLGFRERFRVNADMARASVEMNAIKESARSLLYRLASDPDRFWEGPTWKSYRETQSNRL